MRNLFSLDGPLAQIMNTVADLVIINLLWLVCSLPIITIGAASVAAHYACQKLLRSEGSIVRNFFASFKLNFKQATFAWLLIVLVAICLFVDIGILLPLSFPGKTLINILLGLIIFICLFITSYLFPLLAQFDNTLKNMIINSLRFSLMHLITTILLILPVVAIAAILIFATDYFVRLGMLWILLGFSLPAYFQNRLLTKVFAPYMDDNSQSV